MADDSSINVLLVEDNPADVEIIRNYFARNGFAHRLTIVTDGEDALELLHAYARNSNSLRPDLVLLDLGLPRLGGIEVLRAMKSDDDWRDIPVIVVTSSDDEEDVREALQLQASRYITKPRDKEGFADIVRSVEQFWIEHEATVSRDLLAEGY